MNEKNLVICDPELRYANILAENFSKREELAVKVYVCSCMEKVLEFKRQKEVHILLIDEGFSRDDRCEVGAEHTFVLGRGRVHEVRKEEFSIRKYQCADQIIAEVFGTYVDQTHDDILRGGKKRGCKLVAVYSPIHRIGKTKFAVELGKAIAEKKKVLYLNLEENPGLPEEMWQEKTLGDVLYYLRQGMPNLAVRIQSFVKKTSNMDYLSPILMTLDLKETTLTEWKELLNQLIESDMYDRIILDVGESTQGLCQLLDACDRISMPILEDDVSRRKIEHFDKNIEKLNLQNIGRNTYRFVMPERIEEYAKKRAKEEL